MPLLRRNPTTSARVVVPFVIDRFHPKSVVDVGCGTGAWLSVVAELGVRDYIGVDDAAVKDSLLFDQSRFVPADLTKPLELGRSFDLVISVEVAEHLPATAAETFIASLAALGDCVLFSAAIPGQGGPGHVNLQWPAYWSPLFRDHSFLPADLLRRHFWNDERIAWWYRQNLVVYGTEARLRDLGLTVEEPLPLVHPEYYLELVKQTERPPLTAKDFARRVVRRLYHVIQGKGPR